MYLCVHMCRTGDDVVKLVLPLWVPGRELGRSGLAARAFATEPGRDILSSWEFIIFNIFWAIFLKLVIFLSTIPPDLCFGVPAQDVCAFEIFSARGSQNAPTVNHGAVSQPRPKASCELVYPTCLSRNPRLVN